MKTIVVAGFGPGISNAVAHRFGKEGFAAALVGRTRSRLDEGVRTLLRPSRLADLRANDGAVLVTNGSFGLFDPPVDQTAAMHDAMGLSIANAAKEKLVRLLHYKLQPARKSRDQATHTRPPTEWIRVGRRYTSCYLANGFGRSWKCTIVGSCPLPVS